MNDQEKEQLTKLVMAESKAFDALLEGLASHPALLAKAIEVHKIHERIGVALGILH